MKLLLFLLFPLGLMAQQFEGTIHYKITIEAESLLKEERLTRTHGDESIYTISGDGNYKSVVKRKGEELSTSTYVRKKNSMFTQTHDREYLIVTPCTQAFDTLKDYSFLPETTSYLGYECKAVKFISSRDSSLQVFSTSIRTNTGLFANHIYDNFNKKLEIMEGALPLMTLAHRGEYKIYEEAVKIEQRGPTLNEFEIDTTKLLVYSAAAFDQEAAPAGGDLNVFYQKVMQLMKYPKNARRSGIEGKVFVEFVILDNGQISHVRVLKGIGAGCDEEAARAVKESGLLWQPAVLNGKKVSVRVVLPIAFRLG